MERNADLRKAVFLRRPALEKIYKDFGDKTIFDYVNSWKVGSLSPSHLLLAVIKSEAERLYGHSIAECIFSQLERHPLISTIDHHGILNHPFFINSNLLFSLNDHLEYLVCLSTSSVSMNNSSWPGCLVYHSDAGKLTKLPLLKSAKTMDTVFASPAITQADLKSFFSKFEQSGLPELKIQALRGLVSSETSPDFLNLKNFSDQAAIISFKFWQKFVPNAPKVIYLTIENVVGGVLSQLLLDGDSLFNFLYTQKNGLALLEKYFGPETSSLFWGVDAKGRRFRLQNSTLTAESIISSLKLRSSYPTSLNCFLVLLTFGITCVGGFNQTTLLTEIKLKFTALLRDISFIGKYNDLAKTIIDVPTENFAEASLIKSSGIDIMWENNPDAYHKYRELAKMTTLAQSIDAELPEIYSIVVPASKMG